MNKPVNIRLVTNPNKKLACQFFTAIRLYDEKKFYIGAIHDIWLMKVQYGRARVVDLRKITIDQVNDWVGYLDNGHDGESTRRNLRRLYGKKDTNPLLNWVLYTWEERFLLPSFFPVDAELPLNHTAT